MICLLRAVYKHCRLFNCSRSPDQCPQYQCRTKRLAKDCCESRASDSPVKNGDKQNVQKDIYAAGKEQKVQGLLRISHCTEDAGSHIVENVGNQTCEYDPQIQDRVRKRLGRSARQPQCRSRKYKSYTRKQRTDHKSKGDRIVQAVIQKLSVARAVCLRKDHARAAGHTDHEFRHHRVDLPG